MSLLLFNTPDCAKKNAPLLLNTLAICPGIQSILMSHAILPSVVKLPVNGLCSNLREGHSNSTIDTRASISWDRIGKILKYHCTMRCGKQIEGRRRHHACRRLLPRSLATVNASLSVLATPPRGVLMPCFWRSSIDRYSWMERNRFCCWLALFMRGYQRSRGERHDVSRKRQEGQQHEHKQNEPWTNKGKCGERVETPQHTPLTDPSTK